MVTAGTTTTVTATTNTTMSDFDCDIDQSLGYGRTSSKDSPDRDSTLPSTSSSSVAGFQDQQCLFCNRLNEDLEDNLKHMSKQHGFTILRNDLLVDIESFLGYCHLVISESYECLFCGSQRGTHQAIQHHMLAKGHCKYDLSQDQCDFKDFYDTSSESSADIRELLHTRASKKASVNKIQDGKEKPNRAIFNNNPPPGAPPASDLSASKSLSARALKQEQALSNQISKMSANDRRNLAHLPQAQQRALLATTLKQENMARRSENHSRGRLESSGNLFGCLSKTRLVRIPPHIGHVQSLKH